MLFEITFKPKGPVGSLVRSFTLFGAICWGIRYLHSEEKLLEMLSEFKEGKPPFLVSSPVYEVEGTFYFPKPHMNLGEEDYCKETEGYYSKLKKLKRISFVDEETFRGFLESKIKSLLDMEDIKSVKRLLIPHASINRITNTTLGGEYYTEEAYQVNTFKVFVRFFDESYIDLVVSALRFAPLGKNKSTGFGHFEVKARELKEGWIKDYLQPKSDRMVLISESFYDQDFDLENSLYNIFVYMGSVEDYYERPTRFLWKKRMLYITAGSVIKVKRRKDHYGSVKVALKEGKKTIYQYGFAFGLFVKEGDGKA